MDPASVICSKSSVTLNHLVLFGSTYGVEALRLSLCITLHWHHVHKQRANETGVWIIHKSVLGEKSKEKNKPENEHSSGDVWRFTSRLTKVKMFVSNGNERPAFLFLRELLISVIQQLSPLQKWHWHSDESPKTNTSHLTSEDRVSVDKITEIPDNMKHLKGKQHHTLL